MNLIDKVFGKESLPLTIIKDPFKKSCITNLLVRYEQKMFSGNWYAYGRVYFKNGNTTGEQYFEGETFDEVVQQMKIFIQLME